MHRIRHQSHTHHTHRIKNLSLALTPASTPPQKACQSAPPAATTASLLRPPVCRTGAGHARQHTPRPSSPAVRRHAPATTGAPATSSAPTPCNLISPAHTIIFVNTRNLDRACQGKRRGTPPLLPYRSTNPRWGVRGLSLIRFNRRGLALRPKHPRALLSNHGSLHKRRRNKSQPACA